MIKLLLITVSLLVFSCDSDNPTEVTIEALVDSVCGNSAHEYLAGSWDDCQIPSSSTPAEDIANIYCGLAGYGSAIQYDEFTSGDYQSTLYWMGAIPQPTCDDIEWVLWGAYGATIYCPVLSNLVCE
tara:strand:- start:3620 stop:4000 length:381 start_codon:yes stop_codon:yes gene_type:complete